MALAHPAAVLAHQGGWDEILLIAAPIVGIGVLLSIAKRRVNRMQPPGTTTGTTTGTDADNDAAGGTAAADAADGAADHR